MNMTIFIMLTSIRMDMVYEGVFSRFAEEWCLRRNLGMYVF
jgi:hypothetical protein